MRFFGRFSTPLCLALLSLLFFDAVILADGWTRAWRWDFTENRRHVLSEGSIELLDGLNHKVRLRLFFSNRALAPFAYLHGHGLAARDLLESIARASKGKIRIEQVEPESFSHEEDLALAAGLAPLSLPSGEQAWLGLEAVNEIGGQEVIAQFLPERADYLEYDLVRLITALGQAKKPVLGIITNLPLDTGPGGLPNALAGQAKPFLIYRELAARFELQFLERDFVSVPETLDALLVAHPKGLSAAALFALDQFLMAGGKMAVFLDPHSEISLLASKTAGAPVKGFSLRSDLSPLLQGWGVRFDSRWVLAERSMAQEISLRGQGNRGERRQFYVLWPALTGAAINQNHPATSGLELVQLASVGVVAPAPDFAGTFTPLLTSSPDSTLLDFAAIAGAAHPDTLLAEFQPDDAVYSIAAELSGVFSSAYDRAPPNLEIPAGESLPVFQGVSSEAARLVVVADSDIFDDRFWAQVQIYGNSELMTPFADNGGFILNLLDHLAGAPQLLSLRARPSGPRPFTRVLAMEAEARQHWQEEMQGLEQEISQQQALLAQSPDEAAQLRERLLTARQRLREIRLLLRHEVDALFFRLRLINLALMPAFLVLLMAWVWLARRQRRRNFISGAGA